jgi:hypothetical protein
MAELTETIQMAIRYARLAPSHTLAAVERLVAPSVLSPVAVRENRTATEHKSSQKEVLRDAV